MVEYRYKNVTYYLLIGHVIVVKNTEWITLGEFSNEEEAKEYIHSITTH